MHIGQYCLRQCTDDLRSMARLAGVEHTASRL
jgi:hypothetical protein